MPYLVFQDALPRGTIDHVNVPDTSTTEALLADGIRTRILAHVANAMAYALVFVAGAVSLGLCVWLKGDALVAPDGTVGHGAVHDMAALLWLTLSFLVTVVGGAGWQANRSQTKFYDRYTRGT